MAGVPISADEAMRDAGASRAVPPTYRLVRPRGIGVAVDAVSRDCLYRLIDCPELPLRMSTREIVKADGTTLLVRVDLPVGGRMRAVAYKRVERTGRLKRLIGLLRPHRMLRCWRLGHRLLERGIATAPPLAVIVPRRTGSARPSYLATEWLEDASPADAFCRSLAALDGAAQRQAVRAATAALARLIGRMHARRISHRDLKVANLLLRRRGREVEVWMVDLDGVRLPVRLSAARRWRDLARLVLDRDHLPLAGRAVRLRFLKMYLDASGDRRTGWKHAWRELDRRSQSLARSKARRRARRTRSESP